MLELARGRERLGAAYLPATPGSCGDGCLFGRAEACQLAGGVRGVPAPSKPSPTPERLLSTSQLCAEQLCQQIPTHISQYKENIAHEASAIADGQRALRWGLDRRGLLGSFIRLPCKPQTITATITAAALTSRGSHR